jgi:hypothetical protein
MLTTAEPHVHRHDLSTTTHRDIVVHSDSILARVANEALAFAFATLYVCSHSGVFMSACYR